MPNEREPSKGGLIEVLAVPPTPPPKEFAPIYRDVNQYKDVVFKSACDGNAERVESLLG